MSKIRLRIVGAGSRGSQAVDAYRYPTNIIP